MSVLTVAFKGQMGAFKLEAAFTVPASGVTALFGPSGCGKTTILRCMAGLTRMEGVCEIDGEIWQSGRIFRPPQHRRIGYVFQEASLFAHLSVRANLLYGAPRQIATAQIGFEEVTSILGIETLLERSPRNLSGGERQRVAIGRALLSQPSLLLMDEPLAALDAATKDEILPYLERLQATLALPMIYVTHDMSEVERLADHLVLVSAGRVIATGPLAALQSDPSLNLAQSDRAAVSLDAVVVAYDFEYGLARMRVDEVEFLIPSPEPAIGSRQRLQIRASDVSLAREPPGASTITNIVPARILATVASGSHSITVVLGLGQSGNGGRILARVTQRSWDMLGLAENMFVHAQIKSVALASRGR
jgi:molybdate transport system ATP-binding protein